MDSCHEAAEGTGHLNCSATLEENGKAILSMEGGGGHLCKYFSARHDTFSLALRQQLLSLLAHCLPPLVLPLRERLQTGRAL